ncbi:transporter substrate-binding domain-containing protein [Roseovarius sp. A21]|uniref:Transporter substrate-binding domain-containing protein n=1 Tax=Roseovarius bejariae TaxID=2576383 RepID=A0A844CYF0_9RHOB|nr:transporter substrate-binding domain-containing protein [Roseovarius bejariae]MRU16126.1 transporter substrate-binding domain-containing protein [Roseovarius bejariae]
MRTILLVCLVAVCVGGFGQVRAETCGGTYTVQPGETLSQIAEAQYGDAELWARIHGDNLEMLGETPDNLRAGMRLRLRCVNGLPKGLSGGANVAVSGAVAPARGNPAVRIDILTAGDFWPFADQALPGGGLLAEVVQAAMEAADPEQGFAIHWVNDRASHHEPLLSNVLLDMGFPWSRPDCEAEPDRKRCETLMFSSPLFEVLELLFVDNTRPLTFESEADMQGKTLCRPKGLSTYIFEQDGRNWLRDNVISLKIAASPEACFRLLIEGQVDGVVLNEFLGHQTIKALGLEDRIAPVQGQPISIDTLHMVAHRAHPAGKSLLDVFDAGLAKIRANGTYQRIVDEHMARVWEEF